MEKSDSEAHLLEIGKLILIIHEEFLKDAEGKFYDCNFTCLPNQ